jgi:endonuclease G
MSRAIEAATLFVVGVVAGGALVYSTRKALPPPTPPPSPPATRKDVLYGQPMLEGLFCDLLTVEFKGLLRYGNPGPVYDIGSRAAFVSSYDRRMRNPAWVGFHRRC